MKRKNKYFIDESFWISLLDPSSEGYRTNRLKYEQLVKEGGNFFTSNLILGLAFNHFRKNISTDIAEQFYYFIFRAYSLGELKIEWIGKKYSREAANILFANYQGVKNINLLDASNLAICKNRKIKYYLSEKKMDILNSFPGIDAV